MEQQFTLLFQKYVTGATTLTETKAFWQMVKDDKNNNLLTELIDKHYTSFQEIDDTLKSEAEDRILRRVFSFGEQEEIIETHTVPLYQKWSKWIVAAAAAIVIASTSIWLLNREHPYQSANVISSIDIAPGKVGATLTLASGKTIRLSDALKGKLAEESGVAISKSADGQIIYEIKNSSSGTDKINSLSTANGETYRLRLPDGSLVWLNASSSLTYSANLNERGKRRVNLEGEAYFEISKDKNRPFIVESKNQQIEVLGTHFNVHAYQNEKFIRTTLLEGSVKVTENGETQTLSPGFEAMNTAGKIKIEKADIEWAVAWKNNKFIFDSQRIQDIMLMIARWYDVEVIYTGEIPSDTFWGSVSRYDNLSKVLDALESTGNVHFKIEGRKIYVSR